MYKKPDEASINVHFYTKVRVAFQNSLFSKGLAIPLLTAFQHNLIFNLSN